MNLYPNRLPQNATYPAVVYKRVTGGHGHTIAGGAAYASSLFQFSIFSPNYSDILSHSHTLRNALQGYEGQIGAVKIFAVSAGNETDLFENPKHGDDIGLFHRAFDFLITYQENVPEF